MTDQAGLTPPSSELLAAVLAGLGDAVPFARHAGVTLTALADGTATATVDDEPHRHNHVTTMHAGVIFTLAETASGGAMAATLATRIFEVRPVVSDASIRYLRPGRGSLTARAAVHGDPGAIRATLADAGRVDFEVVVDVSDERDRPVAEFRATWVVTAPAVA